MNKNPFLLAAIFAAALYSGCTDIPDELYSEPGPNNNPNNDSGWGIFTDKNDSGNSKASNCDEHGNNCTIIASDGPFQYAIIDRYTLDKGNSTNPDAPLIGLTLHNDGNTTAASRDVSNCELGYVYYYKGTQHRFRVPTTKTVNEGKYHYHFKEIEGASYNWTEAKILSWELEREPWGPNDPTIQFYASEATQFEWVILGKIPNTPKTGSLLIRDFRCLGE